MHVFPSLVSGTRTLLRLERQTQVFKTKRQTPEPDSPIPRLKHWPRTHGEVRKREEAREAPLSVVHGCCTDLLKLQVKRLRGANCDVKDFALEDLEFASVAEELRGSAVVRLC